MNPVELLEKAINEHGSSVILKERLDLVRDQLEAQERRIGDLKAEHAKAVQELQSAHTKEIARLGEQHAIEMARLERVIAQLQKPQQPAQPRIGDEEDSIVKVIASVGQAVSEGELSQVLNMHLTKVKHHLDKLRQLGFADSGVGSRSRGLLWELTTAGNAYAVENNLIGPPPFRPPDEGSGFLRARR